MHISWWKPTLRTLPGLLTAASVLIFAARAAEQNQDEGKAAPDNTMLELGRQVFTELAEPQCKLCHSLKHAGATGEIGPKLDDLKPDAKRVKLAVKGGLGVMPAYDEILTAEQIEAVSQYVAAVAGGKQAADATPVR